MPTLALARALARRPRYIEPYPLVDKKNGRKYKAALLKVFTDILDKVKQPTVLDEWRAPP